MKNAGMEESKRRLLGILSVAAGLLVMTAGVVLDAALLRAVGCVGLGITLWRLASDA